LRDWALAKTQAGPRPKRETALFLALHMPTSIRANTRSAATRELCRVPSGRVGEAFDGAFEGGPEFGAGDVLAFGDDVVAGCPHVPHDAVA
jgi:hypothetical protein